MNDLPSNPVSTQAPESAGLRDSIESLRTLFQLAVLCGIVLSASISFLVFKQVAGMRRQAATMQMLIDDHNTNWYPRVQAARTNLEAYAAKDPTLAPILHKYFSTNSPTKGH
jgi:hypothetical protein